MLCHLSVCLNVLCFDAFVFLSNGAMLVELFNKNDGDYDDHDDDDDHDHDHDDDD